MWFLFSFSIPEQLGRTVLPSLLRIGSEICFLGRMEKCRGTLIIRPFCLYWPYGQKEGSGNFLWEKYYCKSLRIFQAQQYLKHLGFHCFASNPGKYFNQTLLSLLVNCIRAMDLILSGSICGTDALGGQQALVSRSGAVCLMDPHGDLYPSCASPTSGTQILTVDWALGPGCASLTDRMQRPHQLWGLLVLTMWALQLESLS